MRDSEMVKNDPEIQDYTLRLGVNVNEVSCPKAGFSWPAWLVMVSWDSTEIVSRCLPQVTGWGSVNLSHLFTHHAPRTRLLLARRERWIFDSHGVILTLIIHWLGPPLFLPWCSEVMLAIWNKGLAKGLYQKNTPPAVRLEPAILTMQIQAFNQLSYPGPPLRLRSHSGN